MKPIQIFLFFSVFICLAKPQLAAQPGKTVLEAEQTLLRATQFIAGKASTNEGYVWYYTTDFTRQWGEMEAYKTMIWLQDPGTISMGHLFINRLK